MAVRNSAVVGVNITQNQLRQVPLLVPNETDDFVFMSASEPAITRRLVRESHRLKPGFWQTVPRGHGQDAVQPEECEGIL